MKKETGNKKNTKLYAALAVLCLAVAFLVVSFSIVVTHAKYVTEIGGGTVDFETQSPFQVQSQQDLVNAIKSGYGSVQIKKDLDGPIIMTGDSLELINDLVLDLNGNEIERNNRESLLSVPTGRSFTIVDSAGGGGLYNPIGTVLSVSGGELNVYGGMFESGPRPSEYFSTLKEKSEYLGDNIKNLIDTGSTYDLGENGSIDTTRPVLRPRLAVRGYGVEGVRYMGNVYFDEPYGTEIERDTYCYVMPEGETGENFATFDTEEADFSYIYYVDERGYPTDSTDGKRVMIFGYTSDIAYSYKNASNEAPNYAAVKMFSGELNVNVEAGAEGSRGRSAGSFYQYFGTWQTSCIYMEGGVMTVSTSGEIATVDPNSLPALRDGETRENSAKYGESACILSITKTDADGNPLGEGGTLDIRKLASATSYNGSVISLSGGNVTLYDANITKNATISHGDDPFSVVSEGGTDGSAGSEFPSNRQYRDAAIFLNGGALTLEGQDDRAKTKSVNIVVNKDINNKKAKAAGRTDVQTYPEETIGDSLGGGKYRPYNSTFGILLRGRNKLKPSSFEAKNLAVTMHGAYSYGIFGTRGKVKIADGSITLDSDSHCYGVYAVNRTEAIGADGGKRAVNVELVNTNIELGDLTGNPTYEGSGNLPEEDAWISRSGEFLGSDYAEGAMRAASCGVYLDSSEYKGGEVTLDNSMIYSRELGVSVYDGTLTFRNGGGITAYNASAVCLSGGDIIFENNSSTSVPSNYEINCDINRMGTGVSSGCSATADEATAAGTHRYEIYLPYQRVMTDGDGNRMTYANENGIRVVDGSLISEGKLTMDFRGLYNDFDNDIYKPMSAVGDYTNYDKVKIKSFAVACINQETGKDETTVPANINIKFADITSSIGGGVKVQGGTITLGDETRTADEFESDISVHTTGIVHLNTAYYVSSNQKSTTWQFFPNLSGGHAIIARGGNIDVYNGSYIADNSNGVAASDEGGETISVNIHNGTFTGNMYNHGGKLDQTASSSHTWDTTPPWTNADVSLPRVQALGPSTYYGLKVMGAAQVNINDGTFGGKNGGAFVRGSSPEKRAVVKIEKGVFNSGSYQNKNGENVGANCFSVLDYSTVYFGTLKKTELTKENNIQSLINLTSGNTTLSVESLNSPFESSTNGNIKVYLFYGTYTVQTNLPFGIGYLSSGLKNSDLFIYNYGTYINNQSGVTWRSDASTLASGRIRYDSPQDSSTQCGVGKDLVYYAEDTDGNACAEDASGNRSEFKVPTGGI